MPYLHLDLPGTYPVEVKRELATRLCKLYAEVMETQLWRPNVGIAELGKDNLYHLGSDGLEPRRLGATSDVDGAARAGSGIGKPRAADSGVSRAHAPAYDSHRYLRRPRQVPSAMAVLAHEKVRYVPAAARGGGGPAGGRRLCNVHAPALGPRGLEHAATRRAVGTHVPEREVHLRPERMGRL